MNIQDSRTWDYLMNIDPDELVDVLGLTSEDILLAFPERVEDFMEERKRVEDEEAGYDPYDS